MNYKILQELNVLNKRLNLLEKKINDNLADDVPQHGKRTVPHMDKPLIPFDSFTYTVKLDPYYDYYRFLLKMGSEQDFNDITTTKQYPHISFYSRQERDRFIELCKQNNIPYEELKGEEIEDKGTQTTSPVPSPGFRDIDG
jgi:hypothetical protein